MLTTQREYFLRMNMGYMLRNRSDANYERLREAATRAICAALDTNPIDVLTHMGHMFPVDEEKVIGACLRNDVVIEINASHRMPEPDVLRSALNRGCMFSIASDAHHPRDVGRMDWGLQTAAALGIPAQRIINTKEQADYLFKKARGKP